MSHLLKRAKAHQNTMKKSVHYNNLSSVRICRTRDAREIKCDYNYELSRNSGQFSNYRCVAERFRNSFFPQRIIRL